jgi:hypothetical protein
MEKTRDKNGERMANMVTNDFEHLEARIRRLEDIFEIQNLQGRYQHYLTLGMMEKIVDLFAKKTPGVTVEISDGGVYEGIEGVQKLFCGIMRGLLEKIGVYEEHDAVSPVIEVAKDGETAKALWFSPGVMASGPTQDQWWCWGKYYAEYVKEDDKWKFWHFHFYLTFRTPFEEGWVKQPVKGSIRNHPEFKPDKPSTYYKPYAPDKANIMLPPPPDPY